MTEAEWLACGEPEPMLKALGKHASARKQRLFACACARRTAELFPSDRCGAAVEVAERYADGRASEAERADAVWWVNELATAARRRLDLADVASQRDRSAATASALALAQAVYSAVLGAASGFQLVSHMPLGFSAVAAAGCHAASAAYRAGANDRGAKAIEDATARGERWAQAGLLRDLFADQFRPVVPHPAWFTSDVMAVAGAIYDGRAFDQMPILADALQDAGCDSDDVLNHCRGEGPHVRGCWVVDLVLGKA